MRGNMTCIRKKDLLSESHQTDKWNKAEKKAEFKNVVIFAFKETRNELKIDN